MTTHTIVTRTYILEITQLYVKNVCINTEGIVVVSGSSLFTKVLGSGPGATEHTGVLSQEMEGQRDRDQHRVSRGLC